MHQAMVVVPALRAKAGTALKDVTIEAARGTVPDGTPDDERNPYKSHAQIWFKSTEGGRELAQKLFTLGLWADLPNEKPTMVGRRCAVALAATLSCAAACAPAQEPPTTRVLLISIDTLRADHLGSYGYVRDTSPNIDTLARSSWFFETAYAPIPATGPSVAALLTGMFPQDVDDWSIPDELETLAEVLAGQGWRTVAAVDNANLSTDAGYAQGFDVYRETWAESDREIDRTHLITATAVEHLKTFAQTHEPFFMWLHYVNPHLPYTPPSGFDAAFMDDTHFDERVRLPQTSGYVGGIRPGVYVAGEHRLAYYVAQYDGEVLFADEEIGEVLEVVRAEPELSDTLIVLTADHGEGLGEQDVYFTHGPHVLESHVRVPLIVHLPSEASNPRRVARPVSTIDVVPTILELAGVAVSAFAGNRAALPLAGESLVLTPEGELTGHRRNIFFASRAFWGVRSREWKMILKTRDDDDNLGESHQLFNLMADREESRNLYDGEPEQAARVLRRLEARRQIQSNYEAGGTDRTDRYTRLNKEALENLRTLGYIR